MARILVVEDDPDIRELVALRLRGHGHRTVAVASAPEALEGLDDRGPPDVAVLDVMLPGMNGLDLLREIRARDGCTELPAVFLSARVQEHEVQAGRDLGAVYLTKPFVASALLSAIERVLPEEGW